LFLAWWIKGKFKGKGIMRKEGFKRRTIAVGKNKKMQNKKETNSKGKKYHYRKG
jgi:hypothetical protein